MNTFMANMAMLNWWVALLTANPTPSDITLDWLGTATRIERRVV